VVVRRGRSGEVRGALAPHGAALERVAPDFEDLFLSRTAERA
jgi:hypothetical protein